MEDGAKYFVPEVVTIEIKADELLNGHFHVSLDFEGE
jgi:hypothetical protein